MAKWILENQPEPTARERLTLTDAQKSRDTRTREEAAAIRARYGMDVPLDRKVMDLTEKVAGSPVLAEQMKAAGQVGAELAKPRQPVPLTRGGAVLPAAGGGWDVTEGPRDPIPLARGGAMVPTAGGGWKYTGPARRERPEAFSMGKGLVAVTDGKQLIVVDRNKNKAKRLEDMDEGALVALRTKLGDSMTKTDASRQSVERINAEIERREAVAEAEPGGELPEPGIWYYSEKEKKVWTVDEKGNVIYR